MPAPLRRRDRGRSWPDAAGGAPSGAAHAARRPRAKAVQLARLAPRALAMIASRSLSHPSKEWTGKHSHNEHKPAQDGWSPYDLRAAVEPIRDHAGDGLRVGGEWRRLEPPGHAGAHEARPHDQ